MEDLKSPPNQEIYARMNSLLSGEIHSDNEFVDYALGKMRECQVTKKRLLEQLQQARNAVQRLELQLVSNDTEFEKYGNDVAHFDIVLQMMEKGVTNAKVIDGV